MALTALMGTYHHNIDAKGRMSFPTKLRDLLGGEFYVTKSINQKCLTIYSKSEWEKLANKIAVRYYEIPKEERNGKCQITISTSFFVPKPFTPFQWARMYDKDSYLAEPRW